MKKEKRISYCESPLFEIAKKAVVKGYYLAGPEGILFSEPNKETQGILKAVKTIKDKVLGITIQRWVVFEHICNIEIDYNPDNQLEEQKKEMIKEKKWKLEVFDRNKTEELVELVREFLEPSNAFLQVEIQSEEPEIIHENKKDVVEARKVYQRTLLNPEREK